jgi:hypothetical protein
MKGNESPAGSILEALHQVVIRDSDRDSFLVDQHVSDPNLRDLFGSCSGRQEESPAVELVIVSVAVPAPPWPEDSL